MLVEFVSKLLDLKRPETLKVDGRNYLLAPGGRYEEVNEVLPSPLALDTLSGIVDFINKQITVLEKKPWFIHVEDFRTVSVKTDYNKDLVRGIHAISRYDKFSFPWDHHLGTEEFIISVMGSFKDSPTKSMILDYAANLARQEDDAVIDDGVSQTVKLKRGVINLEQKKITNPVLLQPYVTFTEIEPPEIPYIFRISRHKECALFTSKNMEWHLECMENIKGYLASNLPPDVRIIY